MVSSYYDALDLINKVMSNEREVKELEDVKIFLRDKLLSEQESLTIVRELQEKLKRQII